MSEEARLGQRAARTRAAILEAAELLFAEHGYASARVEDVATRVGIKRASIVYYFRDKRELYDAVLSEVVGGLQVRIEEALSSPAPLPERLEAAVGAWVDYVGARPSFARILLREIADGARDGGAVLRRLTAPFHELIQKQVGERPDPAGAQLSPVDPIQVASSIAGATVFYVAAIPALLPELDFDPTREGPLAVHRAQLLDTLRRLLGTGPVEAERS